MSDFKPKQIKIDPVSRAADGLGYKIHTVKIRNDSTHVIESLALNCTFWGLRTSCQEIALKDLLPGEERSLQFKNGQNLIMHATATGRLQDGREFRREVDYDSMGYFFREIGTALAAPVVWAVRKLASPKPPAIDLRQ